MWSDTDLYEILQTHQQRYPSLAPQDVYKLLYQRIFGPEHSVSDWRAAWGTLYLEVLELPGDATSLPLYEPLSSQLGRVHLQPLQQQGISVQLLWTAFRQTLQHFRPGAREDFLRSWHVALETPWAHSYPPAELAQFWQQMATADFPPVHHSPAYRIAHQPHYRVVLRAAAARLLSILPALP